MPSNWVATCPPNKKDLGRQPWLKMGEHGEVHDSSQEGKRLSKARPQPISNHSTQTLHKSKIAHFLTRSLFSLLSPHDVLALLHPPINVCMSVSHTHDQLVRTNATINSRGHSPTASAQEPLGIPRAPW